MVSIGFLGAFLGGVLAILSPCSALLLPAFFAYAFTLLRTTSARFLRLRFHLEAATRGPNPCVLPRLVLRARTRWRGCREPRWPAHATP